MGEAEFKLNGMAVAVSGALAEASALGQLAFFTEFLEVSGLFERWVAHCPMAIAGKPTALFPAEARRGESPPQINSMQERPKDGKEWGRGSEMVRHGRMGYAAVAFFGERFECGGILPAGRDRRRELLPLARPGSVRPPRTARAAKASRCRPLSTWVRWVRRGRQAGARQALWQDLLSGQLFVLISRRATQMKVLYWDRTGFCVWAKRLEAGRFLSDWSKAATREKDWTGRD